MKNALRAVISAGRILRESLREIFDESAYTRFLQRTQQASSATAYSTFSREQELTQARRPRCC